MYVYVCWLAGGGFLSAVRNIISRFHSLFACSVMVGCAKDASVATVVSVHHHHQLWSRAFSCCVLLSCYRLTTTTASSSLPSWVYFPRPKL